jgi:hypothetical protein
MAVIQAEGFAQPFDSDGEIYPAFRSQIPALRSFYLGFDIGDPTPSDHEIALIQVLAGGNSEDLSPDAENQPARIPDGRLQVALQDADPSKEEFFYRISHSTLRVPGAHRYQIRDVGCVAQCVRKLPSKVLSGGPTPPLLALVGFKLFFTGGAEHELDRVGVWFRDDNLYIAMRDQNGDDTFGYLVDFVAIPRVSLNITTGIQRGSVRGAQTIHFPTPPRTDLMLTGWALNYQSGDHEICDIGVDRRGDNFTIFYSDKNGDDPFDWRIEWAHVEPMVAKP